MQLPSGTKGHKYGLSFHLLIYFVNVTSEGSGKTGQRGRLAKAFADLTDSTCLHEQKFMILTKIEP